MDVYQLQKVSNYLKTKYGYSYVLFQTVDASKCIVLVAPRNTPEGSVIGIAYVVGSRIIINVYEIVDSSVTL